MFRSLSCVTKKLTLIQRSKLIKGIKNGFSSKSSFHDEKIISPYEYLKEFKLELKADRKAFKDELKADLVDLRKDLLASQIALREDLQASQIALREDLQASQNALRKDLQALSEKLDDQFSNQFYILAASIIFAGGVLALAGSAGFGLRLRLAHYFRTKYE